MSVEIVQWIRMPNRYLNMLHELNELLSPSPKPVSYTAQAGKQHSLHLKGVSMARGVATNDLFFSVILTVFGFSANSRQVLCLWTPHNGNGKRPKLLRTGNLGRAL